MQQPKPHRAACGRQFWLDARRDDSGTVVDPLPVESGEPSPPVDASCFSIAGVHVVFVPWRTRSTTVNTAGTGETFRITHPYHPLYGREYKLITYCHGWGSHRVYFHDDAGRLRKIPACWTDVVAEDPFVVVAAGRSAFRVADLLTLADLIEVLQPQRRRRDPRSSVKVSS